MAGQAIKIIERFMLLLLIMYQNLQPVAKQQEYGGTKWNKNERTSSNEREIEWISLLLVSGQNTFEPFSTLSICTQVE